MKSLKLAIDSISKSEWSGFKQLSRTIGIKLAGMGWWNNKCYKINQNENDGCKEQLLKRGEKEVPFNREIFKRSHARFGLGGQPVAYFSNDFALNCCEMIEQLRDCENLQWDELKAYLNGKTNPTPNLMWHPISVLISEDALILDLMDNSISFLELLAKKGSWKSKEHLMDEVVLNRSSSAYRKTQEISKAASENGFQGVCYQSVRTPKDVVLPDRNLVVFDKQIISRKYC